MAFKITLKNSKNLSIELGGLNSPYTLYDITGINPPTATINTSRSALRDGAYFNSSKADVRIINIAFTIEYAAEINRLYAYKVLKSKEPITFIYESDKRSVTIQGYIESIDVSYMSMKQIVTVQILCPYPYFKSLDTITNDLNTVVSSFTFPFGISADDPIPLSYIQKLANVTVINNGEIDAGLILTLRADGAVNNPKILNYDTGKFIGLNFDMQQGDVITINTFIGERSITLLRKGITSNIFNYLMKNTTWLQLESGNNTFIYEADTGADNLFITFSHNNLYEGV